jgi:uroporphyrinogen-III synthase
MTSEASSPRPSRPPRPPVRVLVTRPLREALSWVQALQAQGVDALAFPLIDIVPLPDAGALVAAWRRLPMHSAVMFVSANAVRGFMAAQPTDVPMPTVQAWGTGPGTEAALLAAGWPSDLIRCPAPDAAQFDSEALWALVQADVQRWQGDGGAHSVLIVRGADAQGQLAGRDWLAQKIVDSGLQVAQCVAYARQATRLEAAQLALARQALSDGYWWLFSSSEAAVHLQAALPDADLSRACALATHPRIAERLKQLGWALVVLVPAALPAQALSIKSLP